MPISEHPQIETGQEDEYSQILHEIESTRPELRFSGKEKLPKDYHEIFSEFFRIKMSNSNVFGILMKKLRKARDQNTDPSTVSQVFVGWKICHIDRFLHDFGEDVPPPEPEEEPFGSSDLFTNSERSPDLMDDVESVSDETRRSIDYLDIPSVVPVDKLDRKF